MYAYIPSSSSNSNLVKYSFFAFALSTKEAIVYFILIIWLFRQVIFFKLKERLEECLQFLGD